MQKNANANGKKLQRKTPVIIITIPSRDKVRVRVKAVIEVVICHQEEMLAPAISAHQ